MHLEYIIMHKLCVKYTGRNMNRSEVSAWLKFNSVVIAPITGTRS